VNAPPPPTGPNASKQLFLPLPGLQLELGSRLGIPRPDRVFVNRNLRMSNIEWIGFDMDYTLGIYRQEAMDALSIELTAERMIKRGYPSYLSQLTYDARFPIRGLLVDKKFGHVLKMDRHKGVLKGYHGLRLLERGELEDLYYHKRIRPHTARYHWIDTLFALSEVTAYSAIVDALEKRGAGPIDYSVVFSDVRAAIDEAHRDGAVYAKVTKDFDLYVARDPDLARTLHKFRSAGKRLFLLTNSPFSYTDAVMRFLLDSAMPEYPSWQHYFDLVVCAAGKPLWFQEGRPFMERDGEVLRHVKNTLERGRIYEGGNLTDFERLVNVRGSSVLYVGDHIFGDILRSKKESSWRTAMIIQELDAELNALELCHDDMLRMRELHEFRAKIEDELRFYQTHFKDISRDKGDSGGSIAEKTRVKRAIERLRAELRRIEQEHELLRERVDRTFHPYWGSLLKEENEMSVFGLQVSTYADIYMRKVSCLKEYSPQQYFRSPYDLMPHEL
jgi:5'-nucleotidase